MGLRGLIADSCYNYTVPAKTESLVYYKITMSNNSHALFKAATETLKKEQELIKKALANLKRDDPFADPHRTGDNASADTDAFEENEHVLIEAQEDELRLQLGLISEAITRIELGTYGTCASCGLSIDENRLRAIPATTVCITCEQKNTKL